MRSSRNRLTVRLALPPPLEGRASATVHAVRSLRPRVEAGDATDRHFDDFYSAINSELRSLDLKLSRVKYPHDKQVYMGVVNTVRTGVVGFSPSARRRRKPHDTVRGGARTWAGRELWA